MKLTLVTIVTANLEHLYDFVIQVKLHFKRAIRYPLPLAKQVHHLIKDGVQVHLEPSCPCGGAAGHTVAYDQARADMGYRAAPPKYEAE
jgi:hypothetical protein